ncbi:FecR domain-containing protein [Sneathiella sp.]|uniref:FecR family protein n=1 Tax=Sneathiella sp. TaxID=1964365 RepID=UPI003564F42E
MFKYLISTLATIVLMATVLSPALAANMNVGEVTRLQNAATVTRQGQDTPLKLGSAIHEDDRINTGTDTRIEITFIDDTKLTIGESSQLAVEKYLFNPDKGIGTAILDAVKGPFRFITGQIGKMANKNVEVRTLVGTIGIRGTDFWGGPSLDIYGVLLLDGAISVKNSQGGRVLNTRGTGVNLLSDNEAPGEVTAWSDARINAAVASVTFN